MKHWLRHICALALGLTLAVSVPVMSRSVYADEGVFQRTVEKLSVLGVLDTQIADGLKAADPMTRGAFIAMCIKALGMEQSAEAQQGKTAFSDVPDVHPYAGYIQTAYNLGLVSGDGIRMYPDDKIKNGEAMKILLSMTGHHIPLAEDSGNLSRYAAKAASLGVSDGIEKTDIQAAATAGDLLTMLYNTLDIDLFFREAIGEEMTYRTEEGRNILTEYLHMEKRKGILTGTGSTRQNGPAVCGEDQVEIEDETYYAGAYAAEAEKLLGCHVTFYLDISDQSRAYSIVLLEETPGKNKRLTVDAENIEKTSTGEELVYFEPGGTKEKHMQIPTAANVIYNGVYAGKAHMLEDEAFCPMSGSVELVDNGGGWSLIRITAYQIYVVSGVNVQQENVADYYDRPLLELSDKEKLSITKKGKEIQLSEIVQWDVLSVAQSLDGKRVSILVSGTKVSGQVAQSGEDYLVIDGETYRFSESYLSMIGGANIGEKAIRAGDSATFYLDVDGKIAAVNTGAKSGNNYAYLVATSLSDGINPTLKLRLFTKAGQLTEFTVRSRVKLDGVIVRNPAEVKAVLDKLEDTYVCDTRTHGTASVNELIAINTKKQNRLLSYKVSEDGQIVELDTVIDKEEEQGKGLKIAHSNYYKRYKAYMKFSVGDGSFVFNNNTVMMNIPGDPDDERGYVSGNKFTHDQMYYVTAYEKENGIVNVILNFNKPSAGGEGSTDEIDSSVSADRTLAVIDYVAETLNEDGETVPLLCMLNGGKTVEKTVIADRKIPELHKGDIIRFDTNTYGEVDAIKVLFQPWKDANMFLKDAAGGDERIYGMVYRKMPEVVEVALSSDVDPEDENSRNPYLVKRFSKVYVYDEERDQVYVGSANDIFSYETAGEKASMVFMKIRYDDPKEMVVYLWKDGIHHTAEPGGEEVLP